MSLAAVEVDPLREPPPVGWANVVARMRLAVPWDGELVRTLAWCGQWPSSMVAVYDAGSGEPVALFYARHLRPRDPRRFVAVGRTGPVGLAECQIPPVADSGMVFSTRLDLAARQEAVRMFERTIRRRAGAVSVMAYRGLTDDQLAVVPARHRVRFRLSPRFTLVNQWADLDGYLRSLPAKWRSQLKGIRARVQADRGLSVTVTSSVDPAELCWLVEVVERRHASPLSPRPPLPIRYYRRLMELPGLRLVTYRDHDRLVGCAVLHDDGQQLVLLKWGTRGRADGWRRDLYFDQYVRSVELMITTGRSHLVLGRGMGAIKSRFGARPQTRWGVLGRW